VALSIQTCLWRREHWHNAAEQLTLKGTRIATAINNCTRC